jgi:hypothetical protein
MIDPTDEAEAMMNGTRTGVIKWKVFEAPAGTVMNE